MDIFLLALTLLMLLVIYFDLTSYTIPNWLNGVMLCLYIPFVLGHPEGVNWPMALLGGLIVFGVGFVIFTMEWMGGGDIKLLIASAPWVGWDKLLDYTILVAILGGLLATLVWLARKAIPWMLRSNDAVKKLPRILREDEPLPYGLAIAGGFLWLLWSGQLGHIGHF